MTALVVLGQLHPQISQIGADSSAITSAMNCVIWRKQCAFDPIQCCTVALDLTLWFQLFTLGRHLSTNMEKAMEELTERQERVLRFIKSHFKKYGYPPTIREIGDHIGAKWSHGVERHLAALERKGYLKKSAAKSRGIRLASNTTGIEVPILGRITAGKPVLAVENVEERIVLDPSVARGENDFLLMVDGLSMRDAGILDGDLVLVRQQSTAEPGDIVAALLNDEEATVKRFRRTGDEIILQPENPDFEPIHCDPESVRIIGKVVAVLRLLDTQLTVKKLR